MKSQEELNEIKQEMEALSKKLHELTEEELVQVIGGYEGNNPFSGITEHDVFKSMTNQNQFALVLELGGQTLDSVEYYPGLLKGNVIEQQCPTVWMPARYFKNEFDTSRNYKNQYIWVEALL